MRIYKLADGSTITEAEYNTLIAADFKFKCVCEAKRNHGAYNLLRDRTLDGAVLLKELK